MPAREKGKKTNLRTKTRIFAKDGLEVYKRYTGLLFIGYAVILI